MFWLTFMTNSLVAEGGPSELAYRVKVRVHFATPCAETRLAGRAEQVLLNVPRGCVLGEKVRECEHTGA